MSDYLLRLENIQKSYQNADGGLQTILDNVSVYLNKGERVAIMGPSGRGKTTLLNIIGLLDTAFQGHYWLARNSLSAYTHQQLAKMRNRIFGFVFQKFFFVNHLRVLDNIALPLIYQKIDVKLAKKAAYEMLEKFSLTALSHRYPSTLSGGQQQRVVWMRALVHKPACLLLDEPTSQLDQASRDTLISILDEYQKISQVGVLIVTHDPNVAQTCDRVVIL